MPNAKRASDIPEPDTSHFRKWTLGMLYAVEPELEVIAARTMARRQRGGWAKLNAYEDAKKAAWKLVGWYARDPRLRNSGASDWLSLYERAHNCKCGGRYSSAETGEKQSGQKAEKCAKMQT